MKNRSILSALIAFLLLLSSCEKVINIDLKEADQKVVIEGFISDQPGLTTHSILLSKTNKFSAENNKNPVSGAFVMVEDISLGLKDTLVEDNPGEYKTKNILGVSGHTYQLTTIVDGKTYTASSTMPAPVAFDSLYTQELSFFGDTITQVIPVFQDPLGIKNFYRFSVQVNDSIQNGYQAWDDQLSDGKINSRPLFIDYQEWFDNNDTVVINMDCIDKPTYDFLNTLQNATGNGQTPANPLTNISGGALGYFTAVATKKRSVIVP